MFVWHVFMVVYFLTAQAGQSNDISGVNNGANGGKGGQGEIWLWCDLFSFCQLCGFFFCFCFGLVLFVSQFTNMIN